MLQKIKRSIASTRRIFIWRVLVFCLFLPFRNQAQLVISPGSTPAQLISAFAGQGLTVTNFNINCNAQAYGTFTNSGGSLSMQNGIILTSGYATNAIGPNTSTGISGAFGTVYNDAQLLSIDNRANRDVCIMEFDLTPQCNSLQIRFVFGSDEYPEYVSSNYNDAFGFFITGPGPNCSGPAYNNTNVATLPNNTTTVTIDNVNQWNNSAYYVNNSGGSSIQYDGITTTLTRTVTLCPCATYHFKIAIADSYDWAYDSGVFIDFIQCSNPLQATTSVTAPVCGCTGTATVNASGGLPPYSYLWSNGQTTQTISNLCPGSTYNVTINDQLSCTVPVVKTVTIPNSGASLTVGTSQTNVTCNGGNNGTATANPSGQPGPYTYSWSPGGQTTQTATNLSAGTYTVTATASNGCSNTASVTITEPTAITATQTFTNVSCFGGCNGTAGVTASGGSGSYTYSWSPSGGSSATASGLCPGNYTCTISTGVGCSITKNFTISQPTALSATNSQTNVSCNGGNNGSGTVVASGGTPGYTYSWSPSGGTAATAANLATGTYTCTITDANNCTTTQTLTITQPTALSATQTQTNVSCNGVCDGIASVTPSGGTGAFTYSWSPSGGTNAGATGLCQGNYVCTISDANGCQITKNFTITQPGLLTLSASATAVSCNGGSNGGMSVIASGGTPGYTYSWQGNVSTSSLASGLIAGSYTVQVQDQNGCSATASATVTQPTLLTVAIPSNTSVSCFGGNDGTATALASGGTPNYTYSWTGGGGNLATGIGFTQGSFTVTATDANGCTATNTVNITQPTQLTSSITSSTMVSCFGGNDGTATVTASGGTAPYTYSWDNGGNQASATGFQAGLHSVTVTDAEGCTSTASINITEPSVLSVSVPANTPVSCNGGNDGSATALASGGTSPYSYSWTSGSNTAIANNLSATSYTVTATDSKGCTATASITIQQPTQVVATIVSTTDVACSGGSDGSATVSASGGTPGYLYSWTNGDQTATASNLSIGSFTATVTDANGCSTTAVATIIQPSAFSVSISASTPVSCFGGSDGTATAIANGGINPYSYSWNNGATTATATGLPANTFTITATDANGCSSTASTTITEPTQLIASIVSTTDVSCFGGNDGTASATANGGTAPYTYQWPNGISAANTANLSVGNYTVSVTDANGCLSSASASIFEPSLLSVTIPTTTAVSCFGGNDGTATAQASGGTPAYTYSWTNGDNTATASSLNATSFSVTVTDSKGCTATANTTITEPTQVVASVVSTVDVSCFGYADGSATVSANGGTLPYAYSWSNGDVQSQATALIAGSYTATITDGNGCSTVATALINQPPLFVVSIPTTTPVSCFGGNDGSAQSSVVGGVAGVSYLWSDGTTNSNAASLTAGNYTLTATDGNGCTATISTTISEPSVLTATITTSTNVSCFGGNDGSATVAGNGGIAPYTYSWSNGGNSSQATSLSQGSYTATVTDANGCTATATVNITEPTVLSVSVLSTTPVSCFGGNDGTALAQANGGTLPYSYSWSNGDAIDQASNLNATTFTVTATDGLGCVATATTTITEPTLLVATIQSTTDVSCFGLADGTALVNASGALPPYSYSWSNGDLLAQASNLSAGTYIATVVDANGCQTTASALINQPALFVVSVPGSTNVSCNGGNDGTASASVTGGVAGVSYFWSNGNTTSTASNLAAGTFTITATDGNGCTATETITITEPTVLQHSIASTTNVSCFGGSDGTATGAASGGTPPYTNTWSNGQTNIITATNLSAGVVTSTLVDNNGCTITISTTITEPTQLSVAITATTDVSCNGGNNGSATALASGGTPNYSYVWTNGDPLDIASNLSAGTYTVTATDANGCTSTNSATISEPTLVQASIPSFTNASCFGYSDGLAELSGSGGTPPYSFNWSNGAVGFQAINLAAGIYTGTITDNLGCIATAQVTIGEPALFQVVVSNTTAVSCFGGSDGTASATTQGGTSPVSLVWSNLDQGNTATQLPAGPISVNATDNMGCIATAQDLIVEPTQLDAIVSAISDVSCNGGSDGSITIQINGGTPVYSVSWPSGNTGLMETNLSIGSYMASITDANGCQTTVSGSISEPTPVIGALDATSDVTCFGLSDGSAQVSASGGTPSYQFIWFDALDAASRSDLPMGHYDVQVVDANGCQSMIGLDIVEPALLEIPSVIVTDASCYGQSNGAVNILVQGGSLPYSFQWSNNSQTEDIINVAAGTYSVVVTDGYGCTTGTTQTVNQPTAVDLSLDSTNISCFGFADGTVTASVTGGTGPFSYLWNTGASTSSLSGVPAGIYWVVVTDAQGCFLRDTVTLVQPEELLGNLSYQDVSCYGYSDGSVELSLQGGTEQYSILWSTGSTETAIFNIPAGIYSVSVLDRNGCELDLVTGISQPSQVVAEIQSENDILPMEEFQIDGIASGGTPGYTYQWEPAYLNECDTCHQITGQVRNETDIVLQVMDTSGCIAYDTVHIRILENVIWVPNAISPNGDGKNDVFKAYAPPGIKSFTMRIFNRWGEQIFKADDIDDGWDGSYKGTMKSDLYVYHIEVKYPNGNSTSKSGTVTVL
ncbi:MAG: choice-of-anchor L domain-containing protein [Bacteroidia bacterium]|nr:choice-of-anchor L domain-containing protein [Bacteroidia bacterium]